MYAQVAVAELTHNFLRTAALCVVDIFLCTLQSAEIALSTLRVWEKQASLQPEVLDGGLSS
ncbi:hypothetical protein M5D96_004742, partial [Drosophila gunungcola]